MLHRQLWTDRTGTEITSKEEIYPLSGDWLDLSENNWRIRPKNCGRKQVIKHLPQEFNGMVFYKKPQGYYKSSFEYGGIYMHRYVWEHHNGKIPQGFHIHHIDGDKANNAISNLELISASDHTREHAKTNLWVGSEANKMQLREAREKAKLWHRSEAGRAWHSEHAKKKAIIKA